MYGVYDMTEEEHKMLDKQLLDNLVEERGIEVIREYLKKYDEKIRQKNRKKSIRGNFYDEVVKDVYELIMEFDYSVTKAMEEIATRRNITYYTVRNQKTKFDAELKQFDYYSFGYLIDKSPNDYFQAIEELAQSNNITQEIAHICYHKYKTFKATKTKPIPSIEIQKFKKPNNYYLTNNERQYHQQRQLIPSINEDEVPF